MIAYIKLTDNQKKRVAILRNNLLNFVKNGTFFDKDNAQDCLNWLNFGFSQMNTEKYNQDMLEQNLSEMNLKSGLNLLHEIQKQPIVIDNSLCA